MFVIQPVRLQRRRVWRLCFMSGDSCDSDDDLSSVDDGFIVPDDETIEVFDCPTSELHSQNTKRKLVMNYQTVAVFKKQRVIKTPVHNKQDWIDFMAKHMKR